MTGDRYVLLLRFVPAHRCWVADVPDLEIAVADQSRKQTMRQLYDCLAAMLASHWTTNTAMPAASAHAGHFSSGPRYVWIVRWRPFPGHWLAECPDLDLEAVAPHSWRDAVERLYDRMRHHLAALAATGTEPPPPVNSLIEYLPQHIHDWPARYRTDAPSLT